jgi:hypothetical protein
MLRTALASNIESLQCPQGLEGSARFHPHGRPWCERVREPDHRTSPRLTAHKKPGPSPAPETPRASEASADTPARCFRSDSRSFERVRAARRASRVNPDRVVPSLFAIRSTASTISSSSVTCTVRMTTSPSSPVQQLSLYRARFSILCPTTLVFAHPAQKPDSGLTSAPGPMPTIRLDPQGMWWYQY